MTFLLEINPIRIPKKIFEERKKYPTLNITKPAH